MSLEATAPSPTMFTPLTLRSVIVRNRIMVSPMCQYSAPDAVPHDWHFVHLGSRAVGGAGIVCTEATAVEPRGRISPYDVGLWNDEQEAAFERIAAFVGNQGAVAGIQLAHAGRKASHGRPWEDRSPIRRVDGGWEVVGPSARAWDEGDLVPNPLSPAEISEVVERFASAAARALAAGFRFIEIHAAHGYLLHSFMSPTSNLRTDEYGGTFENRIRIVCETVDAVRAEWPDDLPLAVRISASDWIEGGWEIDDSVRLARVLADHGVDVIDCSSGGASPEQSIRPEPGYQVPFSARIKRDTGITTAAVGLLTDPAHVEEILATKQADLAVLGRVALWDPYWTFHAAAALGLEPDLPIQYARSAVHAGRIG